MLHLSGQHSRNCLALTVALVTCLILLINVSFKIIALQEFIFSASSVLSAVVACIYLLILYECDVRQQKHILNQALLSLYLFSIGIFLLVNLPPAHYTRDNTAYQIVFDDIPRKFFAATLSFGISFYLPHLFLRNRYSAIFTKPKQCFLLALFGGISFFLLDFYLLFTDSQVENLRVIFMDSSLVVSTVMSVMGVVYLTLILLPGKSKLIASSPIPVYCNKPNFHYLVSFAVTILLICLACEYRLLDFANGWTLVASGILFPLTLIASNLVGELYGWRANVRFTIVLVLTELAFDGILMLSILLPAPDFFNLNPFYAFIMPRRILASALGLLISLIANALLLEYLKKTIYGEHRWLRIFIANVVVNSLLCLVNYSLLFAGIYPYEQIFNLVINGWMYKLLVTVLTLPFVLWVYNIFSRQLLKSVSH